MFITARCYVDSAALEMSHTFRVPPKDVYPEPKAHCSPGYRNGADLVLATTVMVRLGPGSRPDNLISDQPTFEEQVRVI